MNLFLWIPQGVMAFLYLAGGAYKIFSFDEVALQFPAVPRGGWTAIGLLEVAGGVLLIVPAVTKWMPELTPLAAAVLAVETLALAVLYASYSLDVAATNPMVWSLVMGLLVAFVAYGRFSLSPIG